MLKLNGNGVVDVEVHEDGDGECQKCGRSLVYVWGVQTGGNVLYVGAECGRKMLSVKDGEYLRGGLARNAKAVRNRIRVQNDG